MSPLVAWQAPPGARRPFVSSRRWREGPEWRRRARSPWLLAVKCAAPSWLVLLRQESRAKTPRPFEIGLRFYEHGERPVRFESGAKDIAHGIEKREKIRPVRLVARSSGS